MLQEWFMTPFALYTDEFQWAPTLGGECYHLPIKKLYAALCEQFQWAPTLGGECYAEALGALRAYPYVGEFQRAPTLGGECYGSGFWRGSQLVYVFQ